MKFETLLDSIYRKLNESVDGAGKYHLTTTYEVVTPESAEQGDVEDSGIKSEEDYDNLYDIVEILLRHGVEASSSSFDPHVWYSEMDGDTDYRTGAETRLSYHIEGASDLELKQVYDSVKQRKNLFPDPMDVEDEEPAPVKPHDETPMLPGFDKAFKDLNIGTR